MSVGGCISLGTKHIIASVKENNPKIYSSERFNKLKQLNGDACKLGCKRKHNRKIEPLDPRTPTKNAVPAQTIIMGEYFWGYGSGIIGVKVPDWGEFILAKQ